MAGSVAVLVAAAGTNMKTLVVLFAAAGMAGTALAQSTNAVPQPGPEQQALAVWEGEWTYAGEVLASPMGPAGKITGRMIGRPVQNGFAWEFIHEEQGPGGPARYLELDFWDPAIRAYSYIMLGNEGYVERGSFSMNGNLITAEASTSVDGQAHRIRANETLADDRRSYAMTVEVLAEGGKWMRFENLTYRRRAEAAPADVGGAKAEQEIAGVFQNWMDAEKAGDVEREFAQLAPDFTYWDYSAPAPTDRAAFYQSAVEFFKQWKVLAADISTTVVKIDGRTAAAHGRFTETVQDAAGAKSTTGGPWSASLVRHGDKWLVLGLGWAPDYPASDSALLEQLEKAWGRAYVDHDLATLERVEADDWVLTDADGKISGKVEDIGDARSGAYQAASYAMSGIQVHLHGDTAVVTGTQTVKATFKGKEEGGTQLFTDTWMKREGRWQCVATHLSNVPPK